MRELAGELQELDVATQAELMLFDQELEETYGDAFEASPNPQWLLASQAFPEADRSAKQEKERFLGAVAIRGESPDIVAPETNNKSTLLSAILDAATGDPEGRTVVENNVSTDISERLFKAANQTRIGMRMTDGKLRQAGRNLTDLHRNALEHTVLNDEMLRRTTTELGNGLFFEALHGIGALDTHDAFVLSPSSTRMSQKERKNYNFFIDTETCSIQLLSANGDDVVLETAFVAGKKTPDSPRHDIGTIQKMAAEHGLEMAAEDGTDMIGYVFLIPKGEVQGVEDIVAWYDNAAGGTFYGEAKPRRDYREYARECEERNASFSNMVQAITNQLISEAHTFKTALDANIRLDELSELYSVKRAVHDPSINAAVFGEEAAGHIQDARFFMQQGDLDRAEASLARAQETAESSSCPWLKNMLRGEGDPTDPSSSNNQELGEKKRGRCPYCGITVKVDPCAERIVCWDCTAEVNRGKVISRGNGGSNKRRAEGRDQERPLVLVTFGKSEPQPIESKEESPGPQGISQQVDDAFKDHGVESFEAEEEKAHSQPSPVHAGRLALAGANAQT